LVGQKRKKGGGACFRKGGGPVGPWGQKRLCRGVNGSGGGHMGGRGWGPWGPRAWGRRGRKRGKRTRGGTTEALPWPGRDQDQPPGHQPNPKNGNINERAHFDLAGKFLVRNRYAKRQRAFEIWLEKKRFEEKTDEAGGKTRPNIGGGDQPLVSRGWIWGPGLPARSDPPPRGPVGFD